jgi:glutaredoxin
MSFRDICPPGMTVQSKKVVRREPEPEVTPSIEEIAKANPVRLFVAPNCNACDLVRNLLAGRNVPFTEKDASQDPEIQAELSALTDGPLTVPTVAIGEQKFTGYHKSELDSALSGVGFP